MDTILRRLPSQDSLHRNRGKIAGVVAGVFGTLLVAGLATVIYTGHGLWADLPPPPPVYPNF